jgi:hypothetical protein
MDGALIRHRGSSLSSPSCPPVLLILFEIPLWVSPWHWSTLFRSYKRLS